MKQQIPESADTACNMTSIHENNDARPVEFILNGAPVEVTVATHNRLSDTLRNACSQSDVKVGCNAGDCGACSVLVNDKLVCACLVSVEQAAGCRVDTLAGLVNSDPCLLYTSPSPRDGLLSRMPSSA